MPTIQRMEASDGVIRGNVVSLMKLAEALTWAGSNSSWKKRRTLPMDAAAIGFPSIAERPIVIASAVPDTA